MRGSIFKESRQTPQWADDWAMNRIITHVLMLGLLFGLAGCVSNPLKRNDEMYKVLVRHVINVEPVRVVQTSVATLQRLQLQEIQLATTAIDASLHFKNANNRAFRILITGLKATKTRIEIFGINRTENREQANLIYDHIVSQLITP